ncbi:MULTISPECIES: tripartite tricarboxylate transporter TctB family protein [Catenuloplanes]|uniref:Tricarboxylic transport membrane protein n=1 Tax=Catenuloplanes niger TaxID=587534 RepID=A0AAE3ZKV4_9ACTN|nr:tripartite tricarboxylate transporter TctB family protein [Catenuloplanes niger]MDR7321166.1 putative tricarboxylic transport membrane protein [Catenuloplanes niger]
MTAPEERPPGPPTANDPAAANDPASANGLATPVDPRDGDAAAGGTTEPDEAGEERATLLLALLMIVGAVVVLTDAATLRGGGGPVGPAAAPMLLGVLLGTLGLTLCVQSRGAVRTLGALRDRRARLGRLAALIAALIAFAVVLPFAGWTLCATALFTAAALLLGAPHPRRIVAYGFALSGTVFLLFDGLIGLILPAGPWGF